MSSQENLHLSLLRKAITRELEYIVNVQATAENRFGDAAWAVPKIKAYLDNVQALTTPGFKHSCVITQSIGLTGWKLTVVYSSDLHPKGTTDSIIIDGEAKLNSYNLKKD